MLLCKSTEYHKREPLSKVTFWNKVHWFLSSCSNRSLWSDPKIYECFWSLHINCGKSWFSSVMSTPSVSFAIRSQTWKHQDAEFTSLLAITIGLMKYKLYCACIKWYFQKIITLKSKEDGHWKIQRPSYVTATFSSRFLINPNFLKYCSNFDRVKTSELVII